MLLSLFTDATLKIGYIHKGIHRLAYDIAIPRAHYRFEAETFAEQLNVLGISFKWPLEFNLQKPEQKIKQPYIVYFPTASSIEKSWPAKNFIELIKYSASKYKDYLHIVLSGIADWEIDIAQDIVQKVATDNLQLMHGGDETESIIANANLLVSNDTGIRNMGIAYYTPTFAIVPPNWAPAFGYQPLFGSHKIVRPTNNEVATTESVLTAFDEFISKYKECNTINHFV